MIQIGSKYYWWLWIAIESSHKAAILAIQIYEHRNMLVLSAFLESLVSKYGRHPVYSNGGTWYPEACTFLHLKHHLHSPLDKSMIERVMQYFKDRTECFDDCYPCIKHKKDYNLDHVYNWIELFVSLYNNTVVEKNNHFLTTKEVIFS